MQHPTQNMSPVPISSHIIRAQNFILYPLTHSKPEIGVKKAILKIHFSSYFKGYKPRVQCEGKLVKFDLGK
jgi:hypothetical protein